MKVKDKVIPADKRIVKDKGKAFKKAAKVVKPVAKDTNKTRRKNTLLPLANAVKKKSKP